MNLINPIRFLGGLFTWLLTKGVGIAIFCLFISIVYNGVKRNFDRE